MGRQKDIDMTSALKRLGKYECENQMSIFDVDWNSIQNTQAKQEMEYEDDPFVLSM